MRKRTTSRRGGVRLIDVRDPRHLKEYGYFTTGTSEVWDTYWVPERTKSGRVKPNSKTNIVYAVNFERGVDVLTVDLPSGEKASQDATGSNETVSTSSSAPLLSGMGSTGSVAGGMLLLALTGAMIGRRRRREG